MEIITGNFDEQVPFSASTERWRPADHKGKIHLFAGHGLIEATPDSQYSKDTAIADVVAVFSGKDDVAIYTDAWIYQARLRSMLVGGKLFAGRLDKRAPKPGNNETWQVDPLDAKQAEVVQAWAEANLIGDAETGWRLAEGTTADADEVEEPF